VGLDIIKFNLYLIEASGSPLDMKQANPFFQKIAKSLQPISHVILFGILIASISVIVFPRDVQADEDPDRTIVTQEEVLEHIWWLAQWSDNQTLCEVTVDHEGLPWRLEIFQDCGEEIFEQWQDTTPCALPEGGDTSACQGLYLHYVGSQVTEREVVIELPDPVVWISLRGCESTSHTNICIGQPTIELKAEEPLLYEHITAIHEQSNAGSTSCPSDYCLVPLTEEYEDGVEIEFWAESSYGDESEHYTALVRAVRVNEDPAAENSTWQVDVLSSQWVGNPSLSCSLTWGAFPMVGDLPEWLSTPGEIEGLASSEPLELLAGRLLRWGLVKAEGCPFGGLLPNGTASVCGVEATRGFVDAWQDRFDARILEIAGSTDVPARLIKNLFAQESQFWPGAFPNVQEFGLGGLHEHGGDTLLLWNRAFYDDFCPLVLSPETCSYNYPELNEAHQGLLRGALTIAANVNCPTCPGGIDLAKAELSVDLFATILRANCDQVGQTVRYISGERPGAVSSYEDLWRFVLVNYNAGPGCLATALDATRRERDPFDWAHVSAQLSDLEACDGSVEYVENIAVE
jgi:hypothetical protein